ncbi:MAG: T9SS type A sorting domain-containing protein [Chitinophagales bacterium]|nr:T9SS type A sorting domain-containing protein [Chitinophagales bacterium]
MHKTILIAAFFLAFSAASFAQQNYYSVKFPDDQTIFSCGGTTDTIWPEITYYSNCNFNVGISVKDQVFNLNGTGGCKKILRTWKLLWWCDFNPNWPGPTLIDNPANTDVGPTVMGNSINHGYLQYTQIIKIVDNVPPVYTDCPVGPVLFCDLTNNDPNQYGANCEGPVDLKMKVTDACSKADLIVSYRLYLDLDGNGSMETFQSSSAANAWPIEKTISGDTVCARVVLPAGVGLPYGKHKIEWITNDRCGNEALCKYEFEVRDCKPPTVVCMNGLSINIMQTGMITLWDTDFLQYTFDNCTPANQIKIGIRKSGTGTGFPLNQHDVTFDCNEIGKQFVEIWAVDAYGNADYCETFVIVQDNIGACAPSGPVTGSLMTDQNLPLAGAKVTLKSNLQAIQQQSAGVSDQQGQFAFAHAPGTCNYSLEPVCDTLPAAGVNTLDMILADMHISGQGALANPYRIIAADVNRDGQLNALDLDAIGNLVVGTTSQFPGNKAWRFVPATHVFPQPANPLANAFPEKLSTVCPVATPQHYPFIAIKTGDVDGSVVPGSSNRDEETAVLTTIKKRFAAGEWFEVNINTADLAALKGMQFTLTANANCLTLVNAVSNLPGVRVNLDAAQNRVAMSWYSLQPLSEETVITLTFLATQKGSLANNLFLNASLAKSEAYSQELTKKPLLLEFVDPQQRDLAEEDIVVTPTVVLYAVTPNPSSGPFEARFHMPLEGKALVQITDANGKLTYSQEAYFDAGNQQVNLELSTSGLYFLHIITDNGHATQKVVVR